MPRAHRPHPALRPYVTAMDVHAVDGAAAAVGATPKTREWVRSAGASPTRWARADVLANVQDAAALAG